MLQECINAYEAGLTVKDKSAYMKPARMCAEFFDARGEKTPNAEDWSAFADYAREEYFKENGKYPEDRTLKVNYVGRAKKFMKWCVSSVQLKLFNEEQTTEQTTEQQPAVRLAMVETHNVDAQPVRVNFMLDAQTYELLSVLAIMEHRTLTAIMKDAAAMYIKEHSEQAGILQAAFQQARSKNS